MSTTEIERKLRDNQGIGLTLVGNDDLNALLAELEAIRSRCERMEEALKKIAENDTDGFHMYTPQAMQAIAARALQQGGTAE